MYGFIIFAVVACVPQDQFDTLAAEFAEEKKRSAELENRLSLIESGVAGIGYYSHSTSWNQKWVDPNVRCGGTEDALRDFSSRPASICIRTGWKTKTGKQPSSMKVTVRDSNGAIAFEDSVSLSKGPNPLFPLIRETSNTYCLEVANQSCQSIYSFGLDTDAPKKKD